MRTNSIKFFAFFVISLFFSCDESLPPRNDPSDLFQIKIEGEYIYNHLENIFVFNIIIINKYEEALENPLKANGSINIKWLLEEDIDKIPPMNIERNGVLTNSHLLQAKNYNPNTNKLIIPPGDSIKFQYKWNLKTDDSVFLPSVPYFAAGALVDDYLMRFGSDMINSPCGSNPTRKVYRPHKFIVSAELQLFDQLSKLISEKFTAELCYINFFAQNEFCVTVRDGMSCQLYSLLQQP